MIIICYVRCWRWAWRRFSLILFTWETCGACSWWSSHPPPLSPLEKISNILRCLWLPCSSKKKSNHDTPFHTFPSSSRIGKDFVPEFWSFCKKLKNQLKLFSCEIFNWGGFQFPKINFTISLISRWYKAPFSPQYIDRDILTSPTFVVFSPPFSDSLLLTLMLEIINISISFGSVTFG